MADGTPHRRGRKSVQREWRAADHRTVLVRRSVGGDEVTDQAHNEGLDATTTESLAEPHSDLLARLASPRLSSANGVPQLQVVDPITARHKHLGDWMQQQCTSDLI